MTTVSLKKMLVSIVVIILALLTFQNLVYARAPHDQINEDWRQQWEAAEYLTIEEDTTGFQFPSAIAFVPEAGTSPNDPLYFVAELRGTIKVVTVDRSVHTFATIPYLFQPDEELPSMRGEGGIAGICLDPSTGYVFVTFLYTDKNGVLRNNIIRYSTEPVKFSVKPTGVLDLVHVFDQYISGIAHQIGGCRVVNEQLFVGVGDGWQANRAKDIDYLNGKIIRMSLDGMPLPDNPFYVDGDVEKARNYVWATGFRNPFALHVVENRMYVADNGVDTDRFVEVHAGQDYHWNGERNSIHIGSLYVWSPSIAPASLQYIGNNTVLGDLYTNQFFVSASAGAFNYANTGIQYIPYYFSDNRLSATPEYIVRHRGKNSQIVAALAAGRDGLYFAPLLPDSSGKSSVYRVRRDFSNSYPYKINLRLNAWDLIGKYGCGSCHTIGNMKSAGGNVGPILERDLLVANVQARLNNPQYRAQLQALSEINQEPFLSTREMRNRILVLSGEEAVKEWITNKIVEPRWDNLNSPMPNLGLTREEASVIADYLLMERQDSNTWYAWWIERVLSRRFLVGVIVGIALGALGAFVFSLFVNCKKARLTSKG